MITRVWGIVNQEEITFHPIPDKPDYWYGICPRVPGLQDIECWAENDKGGRGHLKCQMYISWYTETLVRLILIPIQVTLLGPSILARLLSANSLEDSR